MSAERRHARVHGGRARGAAPDGVGTLHFRLREKRWSLGDDYWIENDRGEHAFKVEEALFRLRKTFMLRNPAGEHLLTIQDQPTIQNQMVGMQIRRPNGPVIASVRRALSAPLRSRWRVEVADGPDLVVKGDILSHEYQIEADGHRVAEVSRRWFRIRDSYGLEVSPDADLPLVLAIAVILDFRRHDD